MVAERSSIFQFDFTNPDGDHRTAGGGVAQQTTLMTQTIKTMMARLVEGINTQLGTSMPPGRHSAGPPLNELRNVGKFSGDEGTWFEWSLKFRATIKECDAALFQALESPGESEIEITKAHVECEQTPHTSHFLVFHSTHFNVTLTLARVWCVSRTSFHPIFMRS